VIERLRLTDEEMVRAEEQAIASLPKLKESLRRREPFVIGASLRSTADAQLRKALWGMVDWCCSNTGPSKDEFLLVGGALASQVLRAGIERPKELGS